jgi:hypothetical protein
MARAKKARKADPVLEAAVEYFAGRSHNAWRRRLLETNPEQKGQPRMRLRAGAMVDVNQPWAKLHPKAQSENKRAARDAYAAVKKFPNDREAAAAYVHECWIKRNKKDPSQPKALFKPYARLPEVEKDKDRAHVDSMTKAIAAVRRRAGKKAPRAAKPVRKKAATVSVRLDAKAWRRLKSSAKSLSAALGREVSAELLASAGAEAMAAMCKALAADSRAKRS